MSVKLSLSLVIMLIVISSIPISENLLYSRPYSTVASSYEGEIDTFVNRVMRSAHIPSLAAAIIRGSNIIWAKGYGENPEIDTVFMVGSISKTFTSVAILQLHEQGVIDIDEDVNTYLPFSLRNPVFPEIPITFRMLLSHTSSLGGLTDSLYLHMYSDALDKIGLDSLIPEWLEFPLWLGEYFQENGSYYENSIFLPYSPGAKWVYSNVGFEVLSYLLELVSGKSQSEYIQDNILIPLGMTSTGYNYTQFDDGKLAKPTAYEWEMFPGQGNVEFPNYNYLGLGSGALQSNIPDLARFSLLFSNAGVSNGTRILTEASVNLLCEEYLGWLDFGPEWDGHGGDIFGFISHMITNLGRGTSVPYQVIVFTNQWYSIEANLEVTSILSELVYEIDEDTDLFPQSDFTRNYVYYLSFTLFGFSSVFLVATVYLARSRRIVALTKNIEVI